MARVTRTPEERVAAIDKKIASFKEKIEAYTEKVEALEAKKMSIINPSMTVNGVIKKAKESGMSIEEISKRLGIEL